MTKRVLVVIFISIAIRTMAMPHVVSEIDSVIAKPKADTIGFQMKKDPLLAIGLSAILPGAGQIYTGEWYKTPFIAAALGGCFYAAAIQNSRYHYTSDSVTNQIARGDFYNASRYTGVREFYRDDRDKWYIYAALVYLANVLDAYISANLYDFDVSDPAPKAFVSPALSPGESWRFCLRLPF